MRRTWQLLGDVPIAAIYCSPSRRAVESAELRVRTGPTASVDDRLREIDFGEFEGLTYEEIGRRFPEQYRKWMTQPTEAVFPAGERFSGMWARVREALNDVRRRHPDGTVVTVSHGGVNRIALATALELDPRLIFRLDQAHASVNVIDYVGDEPLVRLMNATATVPC